MTAKQMGRKRWEGTTAEQRKKQGEYGKLGGRPICQCGECPACKRRAKAAKL